MSFGNLFVCGLTAKLGMCVTIYKIVGDLCEGLQRTWIFVLGCLVFLAEKCPQKREEARRGQKRPRPAQAHSCGPMQGQKGQVDPDRPMQLQAPGGPRKARAAPDRSRAPRGPEL